MVYYVYGVWESVYYITSMVYGSLYVILLLWCLGVCIVYYVYGVWESVCSITSMVSGSLYVLLRLWCMGVCMLYYFYGVWESVSSITSMDNIQTPIHHRRNIVYRLPDTIDVIDHTDSQTP
jgi:glycerol-3-phosphate acyltransferase PlsY